MGDRPIEELGSETPLAVAHTPNLDFLARTGKTGLMYSVGQGIAPESDVAVVSILGYDPFRYHASRGILEALGAGLTVEAGDLCLRGNFATLGENNRILDRRAGRNVTTGEATELANAINCQVTLTAHPASFQFQNTVSHRGVLVVRSKLRKLSSDVSNTDPAYIRVQGIGVAEPQAKMLLKRCRPLAKTEEARISATLVNEFTKKSAAILREHEINKRRETEGKRKANVILLRDAGHTLPKFLPLNQQYDLHFACLVDMPVEKGIAKLTGMEPVELPPPSKNLEKDSKLRAEKLLGILPDYDCFYVHIKGPDEPGHDGNYALKTHMLAIIDEYFLGNLLQNLNLESHVICVTADHSTPCTLRTHSDDPVPLLISGNKIQGDNVQTFSETACKAGELGRLMRGTELMPKLVEYLKKRS